MLAIGVRLAFAAVLLAAAAAKLARPAAAQAAFSTFGLQRRSTQSLAWAATVVTEAVLAVAVALGSAIAAYFAAALLGLFAFAIARALARGRAGEPCACFGSHSRVSRTALTRNLVLGGGFLAVPQIPEVLSTQGWLALGLAVALLAIGGLAVAVLALAREIGALRLALAPEVALDVAHEGPEVGSRSDLMQRFDLDGAALAVAVFVSPGCPLCDALQPALGVVQRDPLVALRVFDEEQHGAAWRALDVPGSPFAVALGSDGTVLAKGTFNSLGQLDGILAAAERRAHALHA
jgi:Methylamine utilisation protein MauE